MEGARLRRIMREIAACEKESDDEIFVSMIDGMYTLCLPNNVRISFSFDRLVPRTNPLAIRAWLVQGGYCST